MVTTLSPPTKKAVSLTLRPSFSITMSITMHTRSNNTIHDKMSVTKNREKIICSDKRDLIF